MTRAIPADEEVRELAQEILARDEFARWRGVDSELFVAIGRWIVDYLRWMDRISVESPILYWLILLGFLLVALALVGHIIWSIRVALSTPGPPPPSRMVNSPPRWADEAEQLAAEGRFLEASHRLALGSIQLLVRSGRIDLGRSDANRVLRERVRRASLPRELCMEFLRLLDRFEQRWFRDRTEDGELYRSWCELHSRLAAIPGSSE